MNFLLHAHLALRDTGSPVTAVGAMLPDLWRMAHRRAHAHRLPAHPEFVELRRGLAHHHAMDAWFHDSEALHGGEARLRRGLTEAGVRANKMGLLAHPLWEMCLDGALVRSRGAEAIVRELRDAFVLAREPRGGVEQALAHALGEEGAVFLARLGRVVEEVLRGPWIAAYGHGDGLAYCLDGVRRRAGLVPLDGDEQRRLGQLLESLAPAAQEALGQVLAAPGAPPLAPEGG